MKDNCGKGRWSLNTDQVLFIERQPKIIIRMGTLRVLLKIDLESHEICVQKLKKSSLGMDHKVDALSY